MKRAATERAVSAGIGEVWHAREDQERAVQFLLDHACAGLLLDPGLGKTSDVLKALTVLKAAGTMRRALIIAPLRVCHLVWPAERDRWRDFHGLSMSVLHGPRKRELLADGADVCVVNPEGLQWLVPHREMVGPGGVRKREVDVAAFKRYGFDTLVMDECFPAGTMISTPSGQRVIETMKVGDLVTSIDGTARAVLRTTKRETTFFVCISSSKYGTIRATARHPFLTSRGWVDAGDVRVGDTLLDLSALRELCVDLHDEREAESLLRSSLRQSAQVDRRGGRVQSENSGYGESDASSQRFPDTDDESVQPMRCRLPGPVEICSQEKNVLRETLYDQSTVGNRRVQEQDAQNDAPTRAYGARQVHGLEQRHSVQGGDEGEIASQGGGVAVRIRQSHARRERARPDEVRANAAQEVGWELGVQPRGFSRRETRRIPDVLQDRLGRSASEDRHQSRWVRAQILRNAKIEGHQERQETLGARVVRVSHQQRERPEVVYNLEVEDLPYYVANGVVVHNCSKFKNTRSLRFRLIKPILPTFARRWGLTGSPVANGLLDLFGQMYVLDMGRSLGRWITHYRAQYFVPLDRNGWEWRLREGADQEIYARIAPLVLRMSADEYGHLPAMVEQVVRVDLPPAARRAYDAVEADLFARIGRREVEAQNAAAASTKCRQIAGGAVYVEPRDGAPMPTEREWAEVHGAKVDALADLVEELAGAPLLVGYEFAHDLPRIRAALEPLVGPVPHLGGGVSTKDAAETVRAWNAGEIRVLLAHPASAGHGLNLQGAGAAGGAAHVCFFGLPWDYELYDQMVRRVRREGSTARTVVVHQMVGRRTVDEAVLWALRRKERTQGAMFEALTAYAQAQARARSDA